jgi:tryptophan synthase alpha chain
MTNRLDTTFSDLRGRGEKGLAVFVTAGYPRRAATRDVLLAIADGGADVIEIGMPFSDPLADGPVIQKCSSVALADGATLPWVIDLVSAIRKEIPVPIVLMGYLNPILQYGPDRFFRDASNAGVDGLILPEVPLEELPRYADPIAAAGIANILLVTPASNAARIRAIDQASDGFLYCVSTTGVTGSKATTPLDEYLARVRTNVRKNPLMVGFGIATPDDAERAARNADGVIVGSAFLSFLASGRQPEEIRSWVGAFKK